MFCKWSWLPILMTRYQHRKAGRLSVYFLFYTWLQRASRCSQNRWRISMSATSHVRPLNKEMQYRNLLEHLLVAGDVVSEKVSQIQEKPCRRIVKASCLEFLFFTWRGSLYITAMLSGQGKHPAPGLAWEYQQSTACFQKDLRCDHPRMPESQDKAS